MSFTIQDIQDKQFHVRFRGFDIDEVDAFLELIVENFSVIIEENKDLNRNIETLSKELERVTKQESSFRNAMISAQKIAEEMKEKSQGEADALVERAREDVKLLKDEAHNEVAALEARVDELRGMQTAFEKELYEVISSYQRKLVGVSHETSCDETVELEDITLTDANVDADLLEEEPDLSDLYEKIDLADHLGGEESLLEGPGSCENTENIDNPRCIPDLDSDIMFTLHDPLDEGESPVDVVIEREDD